MKDEPCAAVATRDAGLHQPDSIGFVYEGLLRDILVCDYLTG